MLTEALTDLRKTHLKTELAFEPHRCFAAAKEALRNTRVRGVSATRLTKQNSLEPPST
jgi:hypothetical protein